MKKILFWIASIVMLAIVISLAIPAVRTGPVHGGPLVRALNNARQLQIALTINETKTTFSENPSLGRQLSDFRQNFDIAQDLFDRMERDPGTYVIYDPQTNSSASPFVRYFGPEGVAEMQIDGMGGVYSWERWIEKQEKLTEQGAAANP